jgi:23S rRNA (pseudouridine1915-N3)-methyltransferase
MKILLLAIGKTSVPYLETGISEYIKRLKHYINFEIIIIPDIKTSKAENINNIKNREGKLLLEKLKQGDHVVLLDNNGEKMTSIAFAKYISKELQQTARRLVFVIGGPYGFSEEVYNKAHFLLSLSDLTFSHQMVRLIFLEQLYRAFTIIKGESYHHE